MRAPAHYSFTFNSRFSYELKHKVCISKTACGIFHFRFRFVFINVYIFVQQKAWILWLSNVIIPFKAKGIEKPHTVLLPDLWFSSYNYWHGDEFLKLRKLKFWERQFFWGSEFSSYEIELENRVTQDDVTLRLINSKSFIEILLSSTSSTSWDIILNFELLTRRSNFYFSTCELLTRSWKIKSFTVSYYLED